MVSRKLQSVLTVPLEATACLEQLQLLELVLLGSTAPLNLILLIPTRVLQEASVLPLPLLLPTSARQLPLEITFLPLVAASKHPVPLGHSLVREVQLIVMFVPLDLNAWKAPLLQLTAVSASTQTMVLLPVSFALKANTAVKLTQS